VIINRIIDEDTLQIIEENIELDSKKVDYSNIKNVVRDRLGKYFYKQTEAKPMIITVIQEV
jgi:ribonuclease J